jgi:hypothetical protein
LEIVRPHNCVLANIAIIKDDGSVEAESEVANAPDCHSACIAWQSVTGRIGESGLAENREKKSRKDDTEI